MPFSLLPFPLPPLLLPGNTDACGGKGVASPGRQQCPLATAVQSTSLAMGISLTISSINCHFPPIYLFCDIFLCRSASLSLFRSLCGCSLLLLLLLLPVYTFPGCAAATATMASNVLQQIRSLIYAKTCFDPPPLPRSRVPPSLLRQRQADSQTGR